MESLFKSIGLDDKTATNTVKNQALTATLVALINFAGVQGGCDKAVGTLLYTVATKGDAKHHEFLAKQISAGRVRTQQQLSEAFKFLNEAGDAPLELGAFDAACGVGVEVSEAELKSFVDEFIEEKVSETVDAKSLQRLVGEALKARSGRLKWADAARLKDLLTAELSKLLVAESSEDKKKKDDAAQAKAKERVVLRDSGDALRLKIREITDAHEGKRVRIGGWIHHIRVQSKKMVFIELRDGTGYLQCVLLGDVARAACEYTRESSLWIAGTLTLPPPEKHVPGRFELHVDYHEIIGTCPSEFESILTKDTTDVELLFDQRHVVLRGHHASSLLKMRSFTTWAFRQHLFERHYFEVAPPTMVQCQAEGGSALFSFDYFGETAYLTQSSQLYLETVNASMGNVFCMLPSFRAEKARTRRHLTEYTHLEAEMVFITYEDLLNALEELVCNVVAKLLAHPEAGALLRELNPKMEVPKRPFRRMEYTDALTFCREHEIRNPANGEYFVFGDDIPEAPERQMTDMIGEPIFLCRFPVEMKAFYMPKCKDDPRLTESVDLLMPGVGEIIGGSMRIWDYVELMAAYKREGISPEPYYWFTDQRRFGSVPHGGYGLGVERFLVWLLGEDHVRKMCLYPRYINRCKP